MTKFRKSILIFGILVLIIGAALGTFIVLSLTGSLKTEAIELEFTVDYAEKEYDGEPLKASSYKITAGFPVEGHTEVVTFTGEQTEVGDGLSGLEVKMINEKGYDVTSEYNIKVNPGVLSVYRSPLRIALTAHDVPYDGAMVDIGDGYTVTGGRLVKGHRIMLQIKDEWFAVAGTTIAGETLTASDVELYILDANGRNVTRNYSVAPPTGRVNIITRTIEVAPVSTEKPYDGKPLTCSQYRIESGSLAAGQYIVADYRGANGGTAEVTDVNTDNPLEIVVAAKIYDINGYDVTDNYTIRTKSGYLTVNRAPLTVTLNSIERQYGDDFEDLKPEELYHITSTMNTLSLEFGNLKDFFKGVTDQVGNSTYTLRNFKITDGISDLTEMFNVTVVAGNLKVTRRKIELNVEELSKTYDGNLTFTENLPEIENLVNNHKLDSVTCVHNSETDSYNIKSVTLVDGQGNNVSANYNITNFGEEVKVTVGQRDVAISSATVQKPYDGTPLSGGNITCDLLADGDKLVYTPCEIKSVSESNKKNKPDDLVILNKNGDVVTGFYNIDDSNCGTLTITRCKLSITIRETSVDYVIFSSLNDKDMTSLLQVSCDVNGYTVLDIGFVKGNKALNGDDLAGIIEFDEPEDWVSTSRLDVNALGANGINLVLYKNGQEFYNSGKPDTENFDFPTKIEGIVFVNPLLN